jgi:putative transposase
VFQTFDLALEASLGTHPLIHSDRGYQYTSREFKRKLDAAGMMQSMSRVGKCIDNGPMESFWGTLKCEKYYVVGIVYDEFSTLTSPPLNVSLIVSSLNSLSL